MTLSEGLMGLETCLQDGALMWCWLPRGLSRALLECPHNAAAGVPLRNSLREGKMGGRRSSVIASEVTCGHFHEILWRFTQVHPTQDGSGFYQGVNE